MPASRTGWHGDDLGAELQNVRVLAGNAGTLSERGDEEKSEGRAANECGCEGRKACAGAVVVVGAEGSSALGMNGFGRAANEVCL